MSKASLEKLFLYANTVNIAEDLDDQELVKISDIVMDGFDEDFQSTEEWRDAAETALDLTSLKREPKNTPFRNASNVKSSIMTTASLQWASRALPELIKGGKIAKYKIIGRDHDGKKERRGKRIVEHLNFQIMEVMDNWVEEHDKLLHHLSIVGTVFTKTWYSPIEGIPKSKFLAYDELIVNDGISSLEEAERVSHILHMTQNELVEHARYGLYKELTLEHIEEDESNTVNVQEIIEQHCFLDLDNDGYKEPYVVTLHRDSRKILRIAPRFNPKSILTNDDDEVMKIYGQQFFSDYHFIPDPAGGFHSIAFGALLSDTNQSINSIRNQLIDAGRLANIQGGFIGSGMRMKSKTIDIEPGEWLTMEAADGQNIKSNIVPLSYKEPSNVLFQMMIHLEEEAKSLTSTTDALTGNVETQNTSPHTMASAIDQSLKTTVATIRRVMRGYGKELKKLVDLNIVYLDSKEYIEVIDPTIPEMEEIVDEDGNILDYELSGFDIVPTADPSLSTEAEKLGKSQAMLAGAMQMAPSGAIEMRTAAYEYFKDIGLEQPEKFIAPPPDPQAPNPEIIELQNKLKESEAEIQFRDRELQLQLRETEAKIQKMTSEAIKNLAEAEAAEAGSQLDIYTTQVQGLTNLNKAAADATKAQQELESQQAEAANNGGTESSDNGPQDG